jgi:hypothetical protein
MGRVVFLAEVLESEASEFNMNRYRFMNQSYHDIIDEVIQMKTLIKRYERIRAITNRRSLHNTNRLLNVPELKVYGIRYRE